MCKDTPDNNDVFLSPEEISRRLPLWCALADLFLDTDSDPAVYKAIHKIAEENNFSLTETIAILKEDVLPAFGTHLMSVAGEWSGFEEEYVLKKISEALSRSAFKKRIWSLFFWLYGMNGYVKRLVKELEVSHSGSFRD